MAPSKLAIKAPPRGVPLVNESTLEWMNTFRAALPAHLYRCETGMCYGEQAKYVTWRLPESLNTIELIQITDVQFGHVMCRTDRLQEYLDWILAEPNRFVLLTGDNIDAWAAWSPGRPFDQLGEPQSQLLNFCHMFARIRPRILGSVGGNHERRALPAFGDLGSLIATLLEIPYSNGRQIIDIYFGAHKPFRISLWHGRGAARTKGGIAQALERFAHLGDAQLSLMGHLHQAMILPLWKERRDTRGRRILLTKSIAAIGTSFMESWGSYSEVAALSPSDILMPRAVLDKNGRWELTLR